ncbi:toxin TcdB middle/N-terminal domain-containing protein [Streptomyces sp. TLI_105]|uniref:toxin TcdB middle/N-terminal domain-containing protein n=1 Tax=Streptomyces sp. TLI_105 TaxID=1881019 RepID=UPI00089BBF4C|nr:toxin TcdB middle/N-terminal domain-containing protein [Streptomyces sp. TLI_105]SEE08472.1 Insecticide toxin TcdB middle/N-terminal region [Streptomyces sp. TLI_105]
MPALGIGGNLGGGESDARFDLTDVNGDGLPDHVKSTRNNEMQAALDKGGRINLLRSVSRPMGARIDLDHTRTGNTAVMPDSRWVLSRSTVTDGVPGDGADASSATFRYEKGRYHRAEREFPGFGRVVTAQRAPGADDAVRRVRTDDCRTDGYVTRGLLTRSLTEGGTEAHRAHGPHHSGGGGSIGADVGWSGCRPSR